MCVSSSSAAPLAAPLPQRSTFWILGSLASFWHLGGTVAVALATGSGRQWLAGWLVGMAPGRADSGAAGAERMCARAAHCTAAAEQFSSSSFLTTRVAGSRVSFFDYTSMCKKRSLLLCPLIICFSCYSAPPEP